MPMSYDSNDPAQRAQMGWQTPQGPQPQPPAGGGFSWGRAIVGGLIGWGIWYAVTATSAPPPPPPPPPGPPPRETQLEQTVLYKGRGNFQVCTRRSLHNCTLTFTSDASGDTGTIRLHPVDIEPAPNCENIRETAFQVCADAGVSMFGFLSTGQPGPDASWIRCAARHGFLYRGTNTVDIVDPRDIPPGSRPGEARLQCDEGYREGRFDNTL